MSNLEDKIDKLIKLATNNPNEEEAKLAALKACLLINQNNLSFKPEIADPYIRARAEEDRKRREWFERLARKKAEEFKRKKEKAKREMVTTIVTKHRGTCSKCDNIINIGVDAVWLKGGTGLFHLKCWVEHCAGV